MKKTIFSALAGATMLALSTIPAFAKVERVVGWDLRGEYEISYHCTSGCTGDYLHAYTIADMNMNTGDFSGTGHYVPNPGYTEDISGNVTDSNVQFHVEYTGIGAGYTVDATGTIADDGTMSGTAVSSQNQEFTWQTISGAAIRFFEGNHGQYVRSQENKQEAAQSRIGMPVQSKGHTK